MGASAVTLYQAANGVMDKNVATYAYDKTFDQVRVIRERVPIQGKQFFAERMTNMETYKEAEVSSVLQLPHVNTDTDRIPLLTPIKGFEKSVTIVQYRSGFMVTRTAVDTQKERVVMKMMVGLPNSVARKQEYSYASLFNSGFDETILAGDGMAVFDSARPKEDKSVSNWSNLAASAGGFTTGSYYTAWQYFQNFTDERGFPMPQNLKEIIYPPALHQTVIQVLKSEKVPENALNAENVWQNGFKPNKYNWLTSSTAWFAKGDLSTVDEGFIMVWRIKPSYASISDTMNPELLFGKRVLFAMAVACVHAKGWYGNAGA
jgi:hypothetical protein